jgi:hypothetical protein
VVVVSRSRNDLRTKRRRARRQCAWEARRAPKEGPTPLRTCWQDRARYAFAFAPWKPATRNLFLDVIT